MLRSLQHHVHQNKPKTDDHTRHRSQNIEDLGQDLEEKKKNLDETIPYVHAFQLSSYSLSLSLFVFGVLWIFF